MIRSLINYYRKRARKQWIEDTKLQFCKCGKGLRMRYKSHFIHPEKIILGNHIHIGENAWWRADGGIEIGDHTIISRNSVIFSANHNYKGDTLPYDKTYIYKKVTIGSNVWIGMNVMIAQGVVIGDGAIIAMGTIVTKNVPPLAIVGSHGSRVIKYRDKSHYEKLNIEERYLDFS